MRARKALVLGFQVAFAAVVVGFAFATLSGDWGDIATAWRSLTPKWGLILGASALTLASYAILIAVWWNVVRGWGTALAPFTATRIWFVSNLGRYVPGKVWQIVAMGTMSAQAGVAPAAAVGSSLFIAVINILAGFAVVLVTAGDALHLPRGAAITLALLAVAVVLTPSVLPRLVRAAGAVVGRDLSVPPLPHGAVVLAFAGCATAWVLYGIGFHLLAAGTLPEAGGATRYYIALFTSSYIAGYLTPWAPGGVGVREFALVAQMELYGLTTPSGALALAIVSRVWLTVLELIPGLLLLAVGRPPAASGPQIPTSDPDSK